MSVRNISQDPNSLYDPNLVDEALCYAQRGWHIFPLHTPFVPNTPGAPLRCSCAKGARCSHIGKHPRCKHWVQDATVCESTIAAWWTRTHRYANIAIATGYASRLVVLDVDAHDSARTGFTSLYRLQETFGPLPKTLTVKTGGNGRHFYFRIDHDLDTKQVAKGYPGME